MSNEEQWTATYDGQDYSCELSEASTWSIVRSTPYGTESVGQIVVEDGGYVAYPQDLPTGGAPLGFGPFETFAEAATELVSGTP